MPRGSLYIILAALLLAAPGPAAAADAGTVRVLPAQPETFSRTRPGLPGSFGAERILLFNSVAIFASDGSMEVTEQITVRAKGEQIRRGIFRTLPLVWNRDDGKRFALRYEVLSVHRDGKAEPYSLNRSPRDLTIRMGSKETLLPPGRYQYTIKYVISNHFSRFSDWDELYWNVTGNEWKFGIDKARFHLFFRKDDGSPAGLAGPLRMRSLDIYTGYAGRQEKNARALPDGSVETTAPLRPGQGLTVAYTWPRAVLANAPDPVEQNLLKSALVPTSKTLILWTVPLLMAGYFLVTWRRLRPAGGMPEVIPLFTPPQGLSAGELRYALTKRYDSYSFAADVLTLVAKGALAFTPDEKGRKGKLLRRTTDDERARLRGRAALNGQDNWVVGTLFAKGKYILDLDIENQSEVKSARTYLETRCKKEKENLFLPYAGRWWLGMAGMICLPVLCGSLFSFQTAFITTFMMSFLGTITAFLLFFIYSTLRQATGPLSFVLRLPLILFTAPFFIALGALSINLGPLMLTSLDIPDGYIGALAACLLTGGAAFALAPRRTAAGLERLAFAKGMILYMTTAEKDRFEALYSPQDAIRRFEELLPYALALGVGKTWAARFAAYLETAGVESEQFEDVGWRDIRGFRSASSSASVAPASSSDGGFGSSSGSGSSGGGRSGGGSGGGGGGGW